MSRSIHLFIFIFPHFSTMYLLISSLTGSLMYSSLFHSSIPLAYLFSSIHFTNSFDLLSHSPFFSSLSLNTHLFTPFAAPFSSLSALQHSTASYQEVEPPLARPISPPFQNILFHLNISLLSCAGMSPGVRGACFPLRNRCSCNYCFDFHPLMPEHSFHKLLQHTGKQAGSLGMELSA